MKISSRYGYAAVLVLLSLGLMPSPALCAATTADADSKAIVEMVMREEAAWNRGDAAAFSEKFDPDGTFTNIVGTVLFGHDAFEKQHAQIFSTIYKGGTLKFTIRRISFPGPDVAMVDIDTEVTNYLMIPPGIPVPRDGVLRTRLLEVLARKDGTWWIVAFHNVVFLPPAPTS